MESRTNLKITLKRRYAQIEELSKKKNFKDTSDESLELQQQVFNELSQFTFPS